MRSGNLAVDIAGKPHKSFQIQNFKDAFTVPYNFEHEGFKFTLKKKVDDDGEEDQENLELEIQGIPFHKHPFMSKDFVLEEDE